MQPPVKNSFNWGSLTPSVMMVSLVVMLRRIPIQSNATSAAREPTESTLRYSSPLELVSAHDGDAVESHSPHQEGQETQAGSGTDVQALQPDPGMASSEDLRRQLHAAVARAEQYANDLSNFKRHTEAEGGHLRTSAQQELLGELGDTLRNLEQVLKADGDDVDPLRQGVAMVLKGLESVYARHDLVRIPVTGVPFDPQLHEAVLTEDSPDHPPGINVREIAPGFRTTAGRVVRPARVSVARR